MAPLPPIDEARRNPLEFESIKESAKPVLRAVLSRILPAGRVEGNEYIVRNPTRADMRPGSFKIRLGGRRAGAWSDFATGEKGGDVISLIAYLDRVSQPEASQRLVRLLGI